MKKGYKITEITGHGAPTYQFVWDNLNLEVFTNI